MRQLICAAVVLGSLALAAPQAMAQPQQAEGARQYAAVSAQRFAVDASARTPALGHGYSAKSLRIADCLATYPGYDPKTDRVAVRPGVSKRCAL
jgi:hypothetical protein